MSSHSYIFQWLACICWSVKCTMSFIKSSVIEILCGLLYIYDFFLSYFYIYCYVTIYHLICQLLWTTLREHKHLLNTKSIVTGWWSYASQQRSVINIIACMEVLAKMYYNMMNSGTWCCCCWATDLWHKNAQYLPCSYQQTSWDWSWE